MKTIWKSKHGDCFDSYAEAYDDATEKMDFEDLSYFFNNYVGFTELLTWALKQDDFWNKYESYISQAENDYFEDNYWEEEEELDVE